MEAEEAVDTAGGGSCAVVAPAAAGLPNRADVLRHCTNELSWAATSLAKGELPDCRQHQCPDDRSGRDRPHPVAHYTVEL